MSANPAEFVAAAKQVNESFSALEGEADEWLAQFVVDYRNAGLVRSWGEVPDSATFMIWRPMECEGLYFDGSEYGDTISCTVPFEYILDPQGWIARTKDAREHAKARQAEDEARKAAEAKVTEIARLKSRLADLEGEQV